jgi:uncharacterized 2Fe-2S/4Fe-4S cluster protein (DUF4445 family)
VQIVRTAKKQEEKSCKITAAGGGRDRNGLGLALDIGTTTVAMALYDLETGEQLGALQEKNAQTVMGADVMMRLMHCQRGEQQRLQNMILEQVEQMARKTLAMAENLPARQSIEHPSEIKRMVVVGNTTMCHIFLGMDTKGLAQSPFRPAYEGEYTCLGGQLGLSFLKETKIYVVPGIDAHVGADAVAMATILQYDRRLPGVFVGIDIGTNAELVLWDGDEVAACSAPAGPAFEGASISQGMRGEPGAVSSFQIAPGSQNILLEVIGEGDGKTSPAEVRGICGSGLIDCIAQLKKAGLVTADGYLLCREEAKERGIAQFLWERLIEDGFVVYLSPQGKDIVLTREDIRQFQLAKAAVQAGLRLLLASRQLQLSQVEKIYIAGVFGGHISKKNAVMTGLFPDIPPDKLEIVGNAAGQGAAQALFSESFRRQARELTKAAVHLEMAEDERFQKEFLEAMSLEPEKG